MNEQVDFIIVGQGIAGTVLALTLMEQGRSVIIIDEPALSNASKIAAGLYNPVVFKRLVKSWMADELSPCMESFYTAAAVQLKAAFFHKKQIVKLFAEENEKQFWLKKADEEVGKYLSKTIYDDYLSDIVYSPLGAAEVTNAGSLDTSLFLNSFKTYFQKQNQLIEEVFNYDELNILEGAAAYKGINAKKIIFCEGYRCVDNPYFKWLPFKLTKGEIITIQLSENHVIPLEKVINKGVFILPLGNNKYKAGATYEWNELNELATEKGRTDISDKLKKILKVPFEVVEHQAGIRPTVSDRRPLIGLHPQHSSVGIFNGMGTKAVMLAPYFAKQFAGFLSSTNHIDREVDISRFNK
jgi:glycine/D-amino acid oxidase-like deaminating enzyme